MIIKTKSISPNKIKALMKSETFKMLQLMWKYHEPTKKIRSEYAKKNKMKNQKLAADEKTFAQRAREAVIKEITDAAKFAPDCDNLFEELEQKVQKQKQEERKRIAKWVRTLTWTTKITNSKQAKV